MKTEQTKLKINELMEHFNIKSVSEFAKLTGITQSNFSRYLSGDRKLSSDAMIKICECLDFAMIFAVINF